MAGLAARRETIPCLPVDRHCLSNSKYIAPLSHIGSRSISAPTRTMLFSGRYRCRGEMCHPLLDMTRTTPLKPPESLLDSLQTKSGEAKDCLETSAARNPALRVVIRTSIPISFCGSTWLAWHQTPADQCRLGHVMVALRRQAPGPRSVGDISSQDSPRRSRLAIRVWGTEQIGWTRL